VIFLKLHSETDEVIVAVFPSNKSSGLDGFNLVFDKSVRLLLRKIYVLCGTKFIKAHFVFKA
jgi:hypothetical protein